PPVSALLQPQPRCRSYQRQQRTCSSRRAPAGPSSCVLWPAMACRWLPWQVGRMRAQGRGLVK
ncbi:unnamed protein product, partial [Closterium sp. NIES-54]